MVSNGKKLEKTPNNLELKTSLTKWSWNKIQSVITKKNDLQSKDEQNINAYVKTVVLYAKDVIDITFFTTLKSPTYYVKN